MKRVLLKDIAKRAGVTVATVSMALRGHQRISESRKAKIQDLAREMGYVPDPQLSALSSYRREKGADRFRETLAFLYYWNGESLKDWIHGLHLREGLVRGVAKRAQRLGYQIDFINVGVTPGQQREAREILKARGIRGVAALLVPKLMAEIAFDWKGLAAVGFFEPSHSCDHHLVRSNHYQSMMTVLNELYARGYRRPAFALATERLDNTGSEWLGAFELFRRIYPGVEGAIYDHVFLHANLRKHLLEGPIKHDVVVSSNQNTLKFLRRERFKIPSDIGFCFLDTDPGSAEQAGIHQQIDLIAASGIDLLDQKLRENRFGVPEVPSCIQIDGVWREGTTIRPKQKSSSTAVRTDAELFKAVVRTQ